MPNITEAEIAATHELVRLLRKHGTALGNGLNGLIEQGDLDPHGTVHLVISADNIRQMSPNFNNLPLVPSLFMKLGAPESSTNINRMITGTGVVTAGYSAMRLGVTTNSVAKGFYAGSILFSSGAVVSGGAAVLSRMCKVSEVALFSEVLGGAFLCLGEIAHAQALMAEGKPVPPHLQKHLQKWRKPRIPLGQSAYNNQNISFIMPGNFIGVSSDIIERIPFETIGKVVGVGLTGYYYYKIVVTAYTYSQKLITKFKEHRQNKLIKYRSKLLHRQVNFLAISICNCPSFRRTFLIYQLRNF